MSQGEIINCLKKKKTWLSARQLTEALDISYSNVSMGLKKLAKHRAIKQKEVEILLKGDYGICMRKKLFVYRI